MAVYNDIKLRGEDLREVCEPRLYLLNRHRAFQCCCTTSLDWQNLMLWIDMPIDKF